VFFDFQAGIQKVDAIKNICETTAITQSSAKDAQRFAKPGI